MFSKNVVCSDISFGTDITLFLFALDNSVEDFSTYLNYNLFFFT